MKKNEKPSHKRVMIIDDDEDISETLSKTLGPKYEVIGLSGGDAAQTLVESFAPDIILLDVNMPGPDGFAVCKAIRARAETRHIPVLFMTARGDDESFIKSMAVGGDSYITKPFDLTELRERVDYLLSTAP